MAVMANSRNFVLSPNFKIPSSPKSPKVPQLSNFLIYHQNDKRLVWKSSMVNLKKFLDDIFVEADIQPAIVSTNSKFTIFKFVSRHVSIKLYPSTGTLQFVGKDSGEFKSRLLRIVLPNEPMKGDVVEEFCSPNDDQEPMNSITTNLQDLEMFIDSFHDEQSSNHSSECPYSQEIINVQKDIKIIYSKLQSLELINAKIADENYSSSNDALSRENETLKQKLNETTQELQSVKDSNNSLISIIVALSGKCSESTHFSNPTWNDTNPSILSQPKIFESSVQSLPGNAHLNECKQHHKLKEKILLDANDPAAVEIDGLSDSLSSQLDDYRLKHKQCRRALLSAATTSEPLPKSTTRYNTASVEVGEHSDSLASQLDDYRLKHKQRRSDTFEEAESISETISEPIPESTTPNKTRKKKKKNRNLMTSASNQKSKKPITVIAGDSMVQNIRGWDLSDSHKVVVKHFSGATTEDMDDYLKPILRKRPDNLILHCGTNDLKSLVPTEICEAIKSLAQKIESTSPNTTISLSAIITRKDSELSTNISHVNNSLQQLCHINHWSYIDHRNIKKNHLNRGGLHLNMSGNEIFSNNFKRHINQD